MGETAPQLQGNDSFAAPASATIPFIRKLEAAGHAIRTWLGHHISMHAAQGLDGAEHLTAFQTAIKRDVARLLESPISPAPRYAISLLRAAELTCLAPERVAPLLKRAASLCGSRPELAAIVAAAAERQGFKAGEGAEIRASVCLVTLGLQCIPWKMLNRWGLRSEADFAAGFNPFALARHRLQGVIDALADDFSDYCQPEQLMMVTATRGELVPARKDRLVLWSHNKGAHWESNDFAPLVENLNWKIANFRAACRRPNPVFVMSNVPNDYPDRPLTFLPELQQALRRHTGRTDNYLILTNQTASGDRSSLHRVDDTTVFFHCPRPTKDYVWNGNETYRSAEGLAYERSHIGLVQESLRQFGLIGSRGAGRGRSYAETAA